MRTFYFLPQHARVTRTTLSWVRYTMASGCSTRPAVAVFGCPTQQSTVFGRRAAATKISPHSSSGSALVQRKLVRRSQLAHAEALPCPQLDETRSVTRDRRCRLDRLVHRFVHDTPEGSEGSFLSRRAAVETLGKRRETIYSLVGHIILHTDEDDTNTVGYDTRRDKGDTGEDESDIYEKAKEPRETTNTPPRSQDISTRYGSRAA
jgi:hypothetical protein